mgnify:CR=1 FL=1
MTSSATKAPPSDSGKAADVTTIEAAVAGAWRTSLDRRRDVWRHPVESLRFWGLAPGQTVVEFWPGTGWYTEILAPFLAETGGKLYAASFEVAEGSCFGLLGPNGAGKSTTVEMLEGIDAVIVAFLVVFELSISNNLSNN